MDKYSVKYSDLFFDDLMAIVQHILTKSGSTETARRFYENVLGCIEQRAYSEDIFEVFQPYDGSPDYYKQPVCGNTQVVKTRK